MSATVPSVVLLVTAHPTLPISAASATASSATATPHALSAAQCPPPACIMAPPHPNIVAATSQSVWLSAPPTHSGSTFHGASLPSPLVDSAQIRITAAHTIAETLRREHLYDCRPGFLDIHAGALSAADLARSVAWLQATCQSSMGLARATFFSAANFLTRMLSLMRIRDPRLLQAVSAACLMIASKVCEESEDSASSRELLRACGGAFTARDILRMERVVIDKLGWDLNAPNPDEFLAALAHAARAGGIPMPPWHDEPIPQEIEVSDLGFPLSVRRRQRSSSTCCSDDPWRDDLIQCQAISPMTPSTMSMFAAAGLPSSLGSLGSLGSMSGRQMRPDRPLSFGSGRSLMTSTPPMSRESSQSSFPAPSLTIDLASPSRLSASPLHANLASRPSVSPRCLSSGGGTVGNALLAASPSCAPPPLPHLSPASTATTSTTQSPEAALWDSLRHYADEAMIWFASAHDQSLSSAPPTSSWVTLFHTGLNVSTGESAHAQTSAASLEPALAMSAPVQVTTSSGAAAVPRQRRQSRSRNPSRSSRSSRASETSLTPIAGRSRSTSYADGSGVSETAANSRPERSTSTADTDDDIDEGPFRLVPDDDEAGAHQASSSSSPETDASSSNSSSASSPECPRSKPAWFSQPHAVLWAQARAELVICMHHYPLSQFRASVLASAVFIRAAESWGGDHLATATRAFAEGIVGASALHLASTELERVLSVMQS
jgi:hypothetical protein